jgi:hypothetical protein
MYFRVGNHEVDIRWKAAIDDRDATMNIVAIRILDPRIADRSVNVPKLCLHYCAITRLAYGQPTEFLLIELARQESSQNIDRQNVP